MKSIHRNNTFWGITLCMMLLVSLWVGAQNTIKVDTTLALPDRFILRYNIPVTCSEVDITIRFMIKDASRIGTKIDKPVEKNNYQRNLFKNEAIFYTEYSFINRPSAGYTCDETAYVPSGDYVLHLSLHGNAQAHELFFILTVDNFVGPYTLDAPIGNVVIPGVEMPVSGPDSDPVYGTPSSGITATRSYIRRKNMLNTSTACIDHIQYFDGLGRTVQTVQKGASPTGADLVDYIDYDKNGRLWREWLSMPVSGMNGAFISNLPTQDRTYFDDSRPYRETLFEASPLGRPLQKRGEGIAWTDHPVKNNYVVNGATGEYSCRRFILLSDGTLQSSGIYPAGSLEVTRVMDEDSHTTYTFTDKQGRLILSRSCIGSAFADTYYVYDERGLLRYVLPPNMEGSVDATALNLYAYCYTYDGLDRCISKKMPGCSPVTFVYDSMDRAVFTQDGNAGLQGRWSFTAYDVLGRETAHGIFTSPGIPSVGNQPLKTTKSYSSVVSTLPLAATGYSYSYNFPSGSVARTVNYYDDYDFLVLPAFSGHASSLSYRAESGYGVRFSGARGYQGKLTGSYTGTDTGNGLVTVYYYDEKGRVVQRISTNHLHGYDRYCFAYTLSGKVSRSLHEHSVPGKPAYKEILTYSYDSVERLLRVTHQLNGGNAVTLSAYSYDDQGRLYEKKYHGNHVYRYSYNLQGRLTGITGNFFSQNLYYNTGFGVPCYNGNISSMTWQSGGESTRRGYKFTYDGLNRLLNATYGEGTSISTNANRFSENVTGYDKNGNIKSLQRYGQTSSSAYGLIDNLTYTLTGNRLNRVDDAVTASAYNNGFEFKNGVSAANEYTYDANGNLMKDSNKGITGIQYNVLNLPSSITFSDGSSITYTYAADGTKLRTVHKIGSVTTTTDYCGNVIYENNTAKLLLTEEGYVSLNDNKHHYYLQDHQGNNRVVINQSGSVEEMNHYYPFGGVFAGTNNVQPYKYNGKEYDNRKGLNWYDYGARYYDAALGRWHVVDALGEKYYPWSTYTYCLNNPILFIDKDGLMPAPGDLFKSKRAAAKDWGMYYNGASIIRRQEMGSSIYEVKENGKLKGYSYSEAAIGEAHKTKISKSPNSERTIATIHAHGNYDGIFIDKKGNVFETKDNEFSKADKANNERQKVIGYLATPNGSLLEHNPFTGQINIVSKELPSDPKDPSRLNKVIPTDNTIKESVISKAIDWLKEIFK